MIFAKIGMENEGMEEVGDACFLPADGRDLNKRGEEIETVKMVHLVGNDGAAGEVVGTGDAHTFDTGLNSGEGIVYFRNHATGNDALCLELFVLLSVDGRDDGVVVRLIAQHAFFLEAERERDVEERGKRLRGRAGDGVGVGVEQIAFAVVGEWRKHWHGTCLDEVLECFGIDLLDITHETEIHGFAVDGDGRSFGGKHIGEVGACKSDGVDAHGLEMCHDVFIDKSAIDHGDDLEHVGIGDASSVDHARLDAELRGDFGGATSTTVYQHFVALDVGELGEKILQCVGFFNDFASDFDER